MVLAYLGDEQPEKKLALAFQTAPGWGTLPEHVETALMIWGTGYVGLKVQRWND